MAREDGLAGVVKAVLSRLDLLKVTVCSSRPLRLPAAVWPFAGMRTARAGLSCAEQADHSDAVAGDVCLKLLGHNCDVRLPPEVPHSLRTFKAQL